MNSFLCKLFSCGLAGLLFMTHIAGAQQSESDPEPPNPLRPDIRVEHYMEVAERSIRLKQDPVSGDFYYNTFEGDVYRITTQGRDEKLYTQQDHGIHRLQGMVFHGRDLFLSGNLDDVNNGLGTKGIVMRGRLQESGERVWSVVAITVEHGGAQTTYDHGFNDVVVDSDGDYLYVNSGARTDHGEVQHNNGNYPGQREVPTTAVILKLPIDGRDILLTHEKHQIEPYIYAKGVRNVYSMAYDREENLFGVSNSSDYDHPEDMFWLREGHHYGFPWIIGGIENPQQYPFFHPVPEAYPLLPRTSHAYNVGYFRNDPEFPQRPEDLVITPPVQNLGPHANYFRDQGTGEILDGDRVGKTIGTFSAHRSPLGLFFDRKPEESGLIEEFSGDGFVIGYSSMRGGMSREFGGGQFGEQEGRDLMHLDMFYSQAHDNYFTRVTRIVDNFDSPTDALMIENRVYVITYSRSGPGHIWILTLPTR